MIGKLTGVVDLVAEDHALIDVGGVGYVAQCSARTLSGLRPGQGAALYVELVVREDALTLYGFATLAEREWWRLLTAVQGVGARVALAVVGALGPEAVGRAIALGDAAAIRAAPGVGPKLAARIVNELRDKAPAAMALGAAASRPAAPVSAPRAAPAAAEGAAEAMRAAMSALANLGYGEGECAEAVARAAADAPGADEAALIRAALRALAPAPR